MDDAVSRTDEFSHRVWRTRELTWHPRWYGSEPEKGCTIICNRETVAFMGPSETDHALGSAIAYAHNKIVDALVDQIEAKDRELAALRSGSIGKEIHANPRS